MSTDAGLVVFTKPARPGRVKTRLIGELTATEAADLHAAFRDDLLAQLAGGSFDLGIAWDLEKGEDPPAGPVQGSRQRGADLGERLFHALSRAAEARPLVAAIGSDHPLLDRGDAEHAFDVLRRGADVVLGPATDGGYYLIGLRREALAPQLFAGIDWSTERVCRQTLERCASLGLRAELLPEASDVDTAADLERLRRLLAADATPRCRRTRALLGRWGSLERA